MAQERSDLVGVLGRVLLALIFIASGLSKIPAWDQTVVQMAEHGIPLVPLFLFPAIFIEVMGGLGIFLGLKARASAAILALYLIPVTLSFHGFWNYADGMERQMQLINFMKNLAILGGLLVITAFGAGVYSLDYRLARKKARALGGIDLKRLKAAS